MFLILFYLLATVIVLFLLGYGLAVFLIPRKLKQYIFWLSPWFTIVFIIIVGVLFGRLGLSAKLLTPFLIPFLLFINFFVIYKNKKNPVTFKKIDLVIAVIVILVIIFNLSPLFLIHKFATTLSLGSNDAQAFALVPDFLVKHSIRDAFESGVPQAVYTLIPFSYRVGQSVLTAFFLVLFNLQGYQFITIFQSVLFGVSLPLIYVLFRILYPQKSNYSAITAFVLVGLNVNLLYYLYHNFFGQILFIGLYSMLIIFFLTYENTLSDKKKLNLSINVFDLPISLSLATLFYTYHEAAVFIVLPVILLIFNNLLFRHYSLHYLFAYIKIALLTILLAGPAIFHAVKFAVVYRTQDFIAPIGWQEFRANGSSFINPFEMIGLYSIHNYPQLSASIAVILSAVVILFIFVGWKKARCTIFLTCFLATYILFIIFLSLIKPNFWFYDRAVSYSLPILVVLFVGGIVYLLEKKRYLIRYVLILIVWLVFINALMLNKRYLREHLAVERWMTTLTSVSQELAAGKKVYSEQIYNPTLPIWKELWAQYFLDSKINYITSLEFAHNKGKLTDNDVILISKNAKYSPPADIVTSQTLWENEFYKLSTACVSDACLLNSGYALQSIDFEKPALADSLLLDGWSAAEQGHRWAIGRTVSLRLINNKTVSNLVLSATALRIPQKVKIFVDGKVIGNINISLKWKKYQLPVNAERGLHTIMFKFERTYKPSEIFGNLDTRELSADFKYIELR